METLVTLSNYSYLKKLRDYGVSGIITGSRYFSSRYFYDLETLKKIALECIIYGLDLYISIDTFLEEKDRALLEEYLEFLRFLRPKGIYFSDFGVLHLLKKLHFEAEYIYAPDTLMTNSLDAEFCLRRGMDRVVLARELTIPEIKAIAQRVDHKVDLYIFGYLKMAKSKRHYLNNYFKEIGLDKKTQDDLCFRLKEYNREGLLGILETKYGSEIYSEGILAAYLEYESLSKIITKGIVDDLFLKEEVLFTVLKDLKRLNGDNARLLLNNLKLRFSDLKFDDGYFHQKTAIKKEDA